MRPSSPAARAVERDSGADGCRAGCGPRQRRSVPSESSKSADAPSAVGRAVGRPPSCSNVAGGGARVLGAVGRTVRRWRHADHRAAARRAGPAPWSARDAFGRVPLAGQARLAKGGSGHAAPQERSLRPGGVEKKLPEMLAACLEPVELGTRRVRLMFQDEARFGRMVRIRRCWAQKPERPVVCNGYEREFLYV